MQKKLKVTLKDGSESIIVITTESNNNWEDEFIEQAGKILRESEEIVSVDEV